MSADAWKQMQEREKEVDQWLRAAASSVTEPGAVQSRRLEKTIIIAASAIVQAIWGARE